MPNAYDVVVIGAGTGGYVAAIRAAQLGLKTVAIESRGALGGTCLNVGCIPSKALLQSSHHLEMARHDFAAHGVKLKDVELDLPTMMKRKDKVVLDLTKGIEFLFRKNKVAYIQGKGSIAAPGRIDVVGADGKSQPVEAKAIVIATGSESTPLQGVTTDEKRIVTSTGGLALAEVPKSLVVIGAGFIGLELGSVWRRLGAKVTVVEFLDHILPTMDREAGREMQRILKKQGLDFKLGSKVAEARVGNDGVRLTIEPAKGGTPETLTADVVLVSVGRRPFTAGLGLDKLGVKMAERGFIAVDSHYQTNVPGIYAIGDVIGGAMLAHKAEDEGMAVAELLAGQAGHVNYDVIPGVVYTSPEGASVGKTEEQLKAAGVDYASGKFPFIANSRARSNAETDGFVKVLADSKTDRILGAHIIGPAAGELIQEVAVAMEFGAAAEDLARTCHGHPGLSEAVKEAALAVAGRAIHV